jgi:hypothetical protein
MRSTPRPRRVVSPALISALAPLLRYSTVRDAYVLRGIGSKHGPVLQPRGRRFVRGRDRDPDRERV